MTDPIADMLTRIRNSFAARKTEVVLPMSKIKYEIGKILERENWIQKCEVVEPEAGDVLDEKNKKSNFKEIKIILKYKKSGKAVVSSIKRISKPGLRIYVKKDEVPVVLNGLGTAIISTPQGLMTTKEARKEKVGGEIICEIY